MFIKKCMESKDRALSAIWLAEAKFRKVQIHGPVSFFGRPILSVFAGSDMIWEGENQFYSGLRQNALGNFQPCVFRTLTPSARLHLGRGVCMSGAVLCAGSGISIGEGTILGSGSMVFDNDFHQPIGAWEWNVDCTTGSRPIQIGRGCFIGARAIVLKGVTIGDRAIVGAGAVVSKDVPPGMLAVGNPCRIVGKKSIQAP